MMNNNNINLILGNHGSGKSSFIYDYFLKNCSKEDGILDLDKKFYLVVPEQDTQDKQNRFIQLAKNQNHGIFNIDVISFDRLCHIVCSECNINIDKEKLIDDDIKRLVLRLAIQNLEKSGVEFVYFKNMIDKVGFTDKLKSAMSELYSYNVDAEVVDGVLSKIDNDKFKQKIKELSIIQDEFKKILKEKNFSIQEDKLNLLNHIIKKSKICDNAIFAFDGFTGFTPIQQDIFYKICEKANEVYVAIDIRDVNVKNIVNNFGYKKIDSPKELDVFYLSKLFINQIYDIASNQHKFILESNIKYFCKNDIKNDLDYLEANIYKKRIEPYKGKIENISIHNCIDIESEVDFLINKIEHLRRTYGYALNDIKVVVPQIDEYSDILIKKCEKNNINIYIDNNKTIFNSPIIEALRSMYDVLIYNFSYDSVMRYLNCGLFNKKHNRDIYLFDNAIRKYGIKGYKKYKEMLEKRKAYIVDKKDKYYNDNIDDHIEDIINIKNSILEPLLCMYDDFSNLKKKYTIYEYINKIKKYMVEAKLYDLFDEVLESFDAENDFDYLILKDNKKLIDDIFEKIGVLSSNDDTITFSEFRDLFNVAIEGKAVPLSPPSMEELECGDLMRSRFDNPKVVFFLGLNESRVPAKSKDNNIIDDYMRMYFKNNAGIILSQTTKETALNQRFYTYLALTNAKEKLYLSWTSKNADGTNDYLSIILQNIMKMFGMDDKNVHKENKEDYVLYTKNDMVDYLYRHLYDVKVYCKNADGKRKIDKNEITIKKIASNTKNILEYLSREKNQLSINDIYKKDFETVNNINKSLVEEINGKIYQTSVSRLEDFARCPYKYFLDYTIQLSEREKYEISASDIGNIFHAVLDRVFKEQDFDIVNVDEKHIEKLVDKNIEYIIKNYNKFSDSNYAKILSERMKDTIIYSINRLKEKAVNSSISHIASEEKLKYDIKDTNDILVGKIDAIDNYNEDGKDNFIRIVDYKSGDKTYDREEIDNGINIQYIVYLDYVLNNIKTVFDNNKIEYDENNNTKPLGTFYFQIHDDLKCLNRDELEEEKLKSMSEDFKYKGIANSEMVKVMDSNAVILANGKMNSTVLDGIALKDNDIQEIIKLVNDNMKNTINDIKNGCIEAKPYKNKTKSCDVCPYEVICKKNLYPKVEEDDNSIEEKNEDNSEDKVEEKNDGV